MSVNGIATPRSNVAPWIGGAVLLSWFLYLLITPTIGINWIESWHNEQRAVQVVLLACTAVAYCAIGIVLQYEHAVGRWPFSPLLLAFLGLGLISAMRAEFVFAALAEVSLFALLAMLAMLTAHIVSYDPERCVKWARWFALLFVTAYVLGVAIRYLAAVNVGHAIDLDVLVLGYSNPRFPTALHAVLIPFLALTTIARKETRLLRVGAAVVLSVLWAINLGLGTRGIWFAFAIGIPVTALLVGWRQIAQLVTVVALTALVGIGLYFILFSILPELLGIGSLVFAPTDNLSTVSSREVLWQLSWEAIKSSPWLGIGPMQFAALGSRVGAHPHNWPLQLAAEWGLLALGLCAVAIFRLGKAISRTKTDNQALAAAAMSVAVVLLLGFVDGNLVMPVSQIGAALAAGVMLGQLGWREERLAPLRMPGAALLVTAFIAVAASTTVAAFGARTLPDQSQSISRFRHTHPGASLVPRFWEQGSLR